MKRAQFTCWRPPEPWSIGQLGPAHPVPRAGLWSNRWGSKPRFVLRFTNPLHVEGGV